MAAIFRNINLHGPLGALGGFPTNFPEAEWAAHRRDGVSILSFWHEEIRRPHTLRTQLDIMYLYA